MSSVQQAASQFDRAVQSLTERPSWKTLASPNV